MIDATELSRAFAQFFRALRGSAGIRTSSAQLIAYQAAVATLRTPDLEDLYWVGRTCLGVQPHERVAYDRVFGDFWLGDAASDRHEPPDADATEGTDPGQRQDHDSVPAPAPLSGQEDRSGEEPSDSAGGEASTVETLSVTPFAACTEEEQALLRALIRRLRVHPPQRLSRRRAPTLRRRQIDMRRTLRSSLHTQGDVVAPKWRDRRPQPRRIVMFLDVSRSMAPYSRLLLHFAHAISVSGFEVEVICFGTRVTRVTRLIRRQRSARALEAAAAAVLDWDGGTRIGEAIRVAQTMGTIKGALRGSVVLMLSDGLEQDDPDRLAQALRRLRRTCHSLVWANPLAGDPRYRPLTAGMLAALPYIDVLCPGDTLAALEGVAASLGVLSAANAAPREAGRAP